MIPHDIKMYLIPPTTQVKWNNHEWHLIFPHQRDGNVLCWEFNQMLNLNIWAAQRCSTSKSWLAKVEFQFPFQSISNPVIFSTLFHEHYNTVVPRAVAENGARMCISYLYLSHFRSLICISIFSFLSCNKYIGFQGGDLSVIWHNLVPFKLVFSKLKVRNMATAVMPDSDWFEWRPLPSKVG